MNPEDERRISGHVDPTEPHYRIHWGELIVYLILTIGLTILIWRGGQP